MDIYYREFDLNSMDSSSAELNDPLDWGEFRCTDEIWELWFRMQRN